MSEQIPETPEELLRQMIAVDSANERPDGKPGKEAALADLLERVAAAAGLKTQRLSVENEPANLLITCEAVNDAPWLLFVSHLDTVSTAGMTIDPFGGEIRDGRIYGRGACDTKGTGAAILWSLIATASETDRPHNLAALYTIDEEFGMTGAVSFIADDLPRLGWRPAGVIVGEPTDLRPVAAHNGVVRWKIHTHGVSAHSSDPSSGVSAISGMVEVVRAIESRYVPALEASHPLTGRAVCSINVIRGGSQVNIIPEHCEIELDRRTVPGEDPQQVLPAIEAILDDLRRADPKLNVEQGEPYIVPPLDPSTNERWSAHVGSILESLGMPGEAVGAKYGTEASSFGQAKIPAVVLGPGSVAQAHTKDEWLALDAFQRGIEVYGKIMRGPIG